MAGENEVAPQGEAPPVPPVEDRIRQLTAERDAERDAARIREAEMQRQMVEVMTQAQQAMQRQIQPVEAAPQLDSETQRALDAILQKKLAPLENILAQQHQVIAEQKYASEAAKFPQHVVEEAKKLEAAWQKQGLQGWNRGDALRVAAGNAYMNGTLTAPPAPRAPLSPVGVPAGLPQLAPTRTGQVIPDDIDLNDNRNVTRVLAAFEAQKKKLNGG